jgi:hypothetical protein
MSKLKVQINKFLLDIWILEFDISCCHLNFDTWNCYLGASKECGRSGVGKGPKVQKLLNISLDVSQFYATLIIGKTFGEMQKQTGQL